MVYKYHQPLVHSSKRRHFTDMTHYKHDAVAMNPAAALHVGPPVDVARHTQQMAKQRQGSGMLSESTVQELHVHTTAQKAMTPIICSTTTTAAILPCHSHPCRNWYSQNFSVFTNADQPTDTFLGLQSVERGNLDAGVLNLTLEWKPLSNLTAEMVEWMFANLHKTAVSPFDGKTYPM